MSSIEFFVAGDPKTAGSKKAFVVTPKGGGKPRAVVTDDAGEPGKRWRADVREAAMAKMEDRPPFDGPVRMDVVFSVRRPKGHLGARGLKPSAPMHPTTKPDRTKMLRALEDAMLGVTYRDDSQVISGEVVKSYAVDGRVGAWVRIAELSNEIEEA